MHRWLMQEAFKGSLIYSQTLEVDEFIEPRIDLSNVQHSLIIVKE